MALALGIALGTATAAESAAHFWCSRTEGGLCDWETSRGAALAGGAALPAGQQLAAGGELVSGTGNARLELQASDGNLVIYHGPAVVWATNTTGHPGASLAMQTDGNLVLYDGGKALWSSGTAGSGAAQAQLRDDCRLVLLGPTGLLVWESPSACGPPPPTPAPAPGAPVDASSIRGKVLAGYQGWFGTAGDNVPGYNWWHWALQTQKAPAPGNVQWDLMPELSEYPASAMFPTGLNWSNGTAMRLYSNAEPGVVDLHFRWMRDYGLDGVLVQRFLSDLGGVGLQQRTLVLDHAAAAAEKHQRAYAVMWDVSGASEDTWADTIKADWARVANYTKQKQYLHEGGKPVVCIFGLGLANHKPMPAAADAVALIEWLKERAWVIGSGPYYWRTGGHDALKNYDSVHAAFDSILPWAVGRYGTPDSFSVLFAMQVTGDAEECAKRGQAYAPLTFAGYSFHNTNPKQKLNQIPRLQGRFMRQQVNSYLSLKHPAAWYYIAMFDEVNEATAIYKAAPSDAQCPLGAGFVTMSSDGGSDPSDRYLTLAQDFTARAHANVR
eukprot:TRINITY_DN3240_c0_g1_i1.p1 TRINITY_DN3240_c0_g1~~TRINITY_DN3240_c0_g1_i1.p1  ORF type:complete len:553 (+),score=171.91 TRINITY_DN3240_c0_g1_i1:88-1746(+)